MKIANIVFLVLYLASAAVQYNDPDPFRWIALYVMAAFACGVWMFKPNAKRWPLLVTIVSVVWIAFLIPGFLASPTPMVWSQVFDMTAMKTEAVELFREIWGLAIVAIWMMALFFSKKSSNS